jgi:hypothetical protein
VVHFPDELLGHNGELVGIGLGFGGFVDYARVFLLLLGLKLRVDLVELCQKFLFPRQ